MSQLAIDPARIVTTNELAGYGIVRSFGVSEGFGISLYTGVFAGGQKEMLSATLQEAFVDMIDKAARQGANAIVGLRYAIPSSEDERIVMVYGTAVKVEKR